MLSGDSLINSSCIAIYRSLTSTTRFKSITTGPFQAQPSGFNRAPNDVVQDFFLAVFSDMLSKKAF
jgi:hypothetical protein